MSIRSNFFRSVIVVLFTWAFAVQAQQGDEMSGDMPHHNISAPDTDRTVVHFPEALRLHTLANMRDHLLVMQQIQEYLGKGKFDAASEVAETRLGLSSLKLHGAEQSAKFMPEGMQKIGSKMHQAASRFAIIANDASVTGDVRPALIAYAQIMEQCVSCHATYRLQ